MEISKVISKKTVIEKIETIELDSDIKVIRKTEETYLEGDLIDTDKAGVKVSYEYVNNENYDGLAMLVKRSIRELHRLENYFETKSEEKYGIIFSAEDTFNILEQNSDDAFEEYELLYICHYDHSIRTLDGKVLPRKTTLTYLDGFHNEDYDLIGLHEHLKAQSYVSSIEINEIPFYNRTDERYSGITFIIIPTIDEWDGILETVLKPKSFFIDEIKAKMAEFYGLNEFVKSINTETDN